MTQGARILVVEDDPHIRQMNYMILSGAGFKVDVAEDGQAGWEALQKSRYDLIITDNRMPRLRGVHLIQKMRSVGMAIPVILAASFLDPGDEVDFKGVTVDGRLIKPFRLDEMLGMVKSVLARNVSPEAFARVWRAAAPDAKRIR